MTIYWTLKSIPELANMLPEQRRTVWKRAYPLSWGHRETWIGLLAFAIAVIFCGRLGAAVHYPLLGSAIGGGVGGLLWSQVSIYVLRLYHQNVLLGLAP